MNKDKLNEDGNITNFNISLISLLCIIFFIFIVSIYNFKTDNNQLNQNLVKEDVVKDKNLHNEVLTKVKQFINTNNLNRDIEVINDEQGVKLQIRESLLFENSMADLAYDSKELLDKIAILINSLDNNIIIEGHTDNVSVNNYKFESNWELSCARATSIVRYFTEVKKLDKKRFTAAGFGDSRPLVDNNTNENRAKNRRMNILIVVK
ncbi:chemotaxis protein MotB [Clostridium cavendishii DSM 21758]|uniref:Chemotaxis protein MotB n=1 Tax=Clostridium cavendishii DSM 21758 TaxID=1121302 RepID=A0A1M6AU12_9CLOT|nr:OmpA family protein [Clostridium cavendishii]SHI40014.1 chemotaxis protein MotB [Clostridium cavendishii DSM 21758]